jgi:hypothetical protein
MPIRGRRNHVHQNHIPTAIEMGEQQPGRSAAAEKQPTVCQILAILDLLHQ